MTTLAPITRAGRIARNDVPSLSLPLSPRSYASDILLLADRAAERFPAVADRVHRGAALLLARHVRPLGPEPERDAGRLFAVHSQSPARAVKVYRVDTEELTCSCPDWQQARAPAISGRRLCKHLFAALLYEATH